MQLPFGINISRRSATDNKAAERVGKAMNIPIGSEAFLLSRSRPLLLSTVYRCVDLISDSVATMPLETYLIDKDGFKSHHKAHPAYNLLNIEPDETMNRFVFFKTIAASILLQGNAYAYIERTPDGLPVQLIYVPANIVTVQWAVEPTGLWRKRYHVSPYHGRTFGNNGVCNPKEIIHFLNFSQNGITGVSTLTYARQAIDIATSAEEHVSEFMEGGGNVAGVLTTAGYPSDQQKKQIHEEWQKQITEKGNGAIAVLGADMKYNPITINPKDSQLLESRQFSVVDICRFFSVSPVKAFDLTKSSYSTLEATQLSFLAETIQPFITKMELEINRKLFFENEWNTIRAEFNTNALLRTDKAAMASWTREMFNTGSLSPNEIRRENNLSRLEDGDASFVQVNMQPLSKAVHPEPKKETVQLVKEK